MRTFLLEYRCTCNYLLFKGLLLDTRLEIKCKRCGKIQTLSDHFSRATDNQYALVLDREGNIIDASGSASTLLGYTPEELIRLRVPDIAPYATSDAFENVWKKAEQLQFAPFVVESFHKMKDNTIASIRARLTFPTIKGATRLLALCEVIDRNKEYKYEPKSLSKNLIVQDLIAEVNLDGYFTTISNELSKKLGYTVFDIVGKQLFDFIVGHDISTFKNEFNLMVKGRQSFLAKGQTFKGKEGDTITFDTAYTTAFFEDNEMRGFKIVCISTNK